MPLWKRLAYVAITRARIDQPTRDYIARRTAEGKTPRENRRCLKRYIARELYRGPDVLLATQPTRGLDVGAIEFFHKQLVAERDLRTVTLADEVEQRDLAAYDAAFGLTGAA